MYKHPQEIAWIYDTKIGIFYHISVTVKYVNNGIRSQSHMPCFVNFQVYLLVSQLDKTITYQVGRNNQNWRQIQGDGILFWKIPPIQRDFGPGDIYIKMEIIYNLNCLATLPSG